jgi:uncharacterized membrane protein
MKFSVFNWIVALCALGSGLIAGVFFAFSTFVMKALGKLPAANGVAAMQSINVVVLNAWFMTAFMGTAVLSLFLFIASLMRWQEPRAAYVLAGSLLYFIGTFGVTMLFNVPRNNALAALSPSSPEASAYWPTYLSEWMFWNHVRTIAALAAAVSLVASLIGTRYQAA